MTHYPGCNCSRQFMRDVKAQNSFDRLSRVSVKDWIAFALALIAFLVLLRQSYFAAGDQVRAAYIGPGAGIALMGSFLAVLGALISAFFALLTWPVRWVWREIRSRKALARAKTKRVVILGLDGLDPDLAEEFIDQGLLKNLAQMKAEGSYQRLGTTWPPLSPVAWSSFSTGTNPGKHNIFDFISRDPADYLPSISSVRIGKPRRELRLGRYRFPLTAAPIDALRKSKPFWKVLGDAGIFSSIIRVPITFPPDKFYGVQLSAMCVPDLRGTQGTFNYFTEIGEAGKIADGDVGGERIIVQRQGNVVRGELPGPLNTICSDGSETKVSFKVTCGAGDLAVLHIDGKKIPLVLNQFTDWVDVSFRMVIGIKAKGTCRFMLKQLNPGFEMYCTPVNIAPDKPVMPISHPKVFSIYLSKLLGTYSTLGLAEDTWSLSEGINNEEEFLEQAYDIHHEREKMFFDSLKRVRRGMVVCVFDGPDRIQHMFWRFIEKGHPAVSGFDEVTTEKNRNKIREMYIKMDQLVGETVKTIGKDSALIVMSDHGFKSFRRGVDLNAWLFQNGYLFLSNDRDYSDKTYLREIDWSRTKAYAIGLAGIFINQRGREANGIVAAGEEKKSLVSELAEKLTGLRDDDNSEVSIHEAVASEAVYQGPYVESAPDLIIGYNVGYRVSWDSAVGKCSRNVFSDNIKAWSGDHCIHPDLVPGVLFSNLRLQTGEARILDLAPTALDLLGVDKPAYMEGSSLCEQA